MSWLDDENARDKSRPRDEWLVGATDTKGHSVRQWFRCQPGLDNQLESLLASKRFPYRTKGDILRHAVITHLEWLQHMEPDLPSTIRQVQLISDLVREDEFRQEMDEIFTRVGGRVNHHVSLGQLPDARILIVKLKSAIKGMPDGPWRDRYMERYKSQFASYITATKSPSLFIPSGDPDPDPELDPDPDIPMDLLNGDATDE